MTFEACDAMNVLLMRSFVSRSRNLRIPLVRRYSLPFCDAIFHKKMILFYPTIKLKLFRFFKGYSPKSMIVIFIEKGNTSTN